MPLLNIHMIALRDWSITAVSNLVGRLSQPEPQAVASLPPAGCINAIDNVRQPEVFGAETCEAPPHLQALTIAESQLLAMKADSYRPDGPLEKRRSPREKVIMPVRCRTKDGQTGRVILSDLSAHGCRLYSDNMTLRKGQWITIQPNQMEGIPALVRWIDDRRAGVEFERPLHAAVAEHLQRLFAVPDNLSATGVRVVSSSINPLAQTPRR